MAGCDTVGEAVFNVRIPALLCSYFVGRRRRWQLRFLMMPPASRMADAAFDGDLGGNLAIGMAMAAVLQM